jgi:hypothetical protein
MAKSALGRGLQHLMKDRPVSASSENPSEKPQVTPGMAALLRGGNGDSKQEKMPDQSSPIDSEALAAATRKRTLIQVSLFIADLVVLGLVMRLAFISHGHFGFFEITLCILALAIGAWLSCLALWLK